MKQILILILFFFQWQQAEAQNYTQVFIQNFSNSTVYPSLSIANYPAILNPGSTDYLARVPTGGLLQGSYSITSQYNASATAGLFDITTTDHSQPGTGFFMVVDANGARRGETSGSYYLLPLANQLSIPGATYRASFWVKNLNAPNAAAGYTPSDFIDAYVGLTVRDAATTAGTLYNSPGLTTITPKDAAWHQYSTNVTIPLTFAASSLYFNFYNTQPGASGNGNDLGLDDIVVNLATIDLSGTVFNDGNGNGIVDGTEVGINGSNIPLFVYVVNNNKVLAKTQVTNNGTYIFANQVIPYATGNIGLRVIVSSTDIALGSGSVPITLPTGYVQTAENVNGATAIAGPADGSITVTASAANLSSLNFGIERKPVSQTLSHILANQPVVGTQLIFNGQGANPPAPFGTDLEDGTLGSNSTIVITSLPTNGILRYSGSAVVENTPIANFNPSLLTLELTAEGTISSVFSYTFVDRAGVRGDATTYTVSWAFLLPVTLTEFVVSKTHKGVHIRWETVKEDRTSRFEIEHGTDGVHFTVIGMRSTPGQSNLPKQYYFIHETPVKKTNYYRLKIIDNDGRFSYSDIRRIEVENEERYSIYPNPASDYIFIETVPPKEIKSVQLIDASGSIVKTRSSLINQKLDIRDIVPGIYLVRINFVDRTNKTYKIIIER